MTRFAATLAASLMLASAMPSLALASDAEDLLSGDLRMVELSQALVAESARSAQDEGAALTSGTTQEGQLDAQEMTEIAAREDTTVNAAITNQKLAATNENNTVAANGDITTGGVTLGPNAFTGFAGVGVFVVNTGANSNLQGSIGVSIVPTQ